MRFKLLGRSGLRVSELALGGMTFGDDWGWGADRDTSKTIFDAYVNAGGNFIDTSINYTEGSSEKLIGEFIQGRRDEFVIATKYTLRENKSSRTDPNYGGNNRKTMQRSVETSLRRLQTEYIDLYYLHMWDFTTPVDEVMRGLDDLVRSGKVHYIGISDTPAWVVSKANMLAELRGWSRFVACQFPYSLASRDPERDIIPMSRSEDIAMCVWGILGGGSLTGKYSDPEAVKRYSSVSEKRIQLANRIVELAKEIGCTPSQVAINWVRHRPGNGAPIIPILGVRTLNQLVDNLGTLEFDLSQEQIAELDALNPIELGFPHDFLRSGEVRNLIFGETFEKIDNHRDTIWW